MYARIIVRCSCHNRIIRLHEITDLTDENVKREVARLELAHPHAVVDTSQIDAARTAPWRKSA